VSVAFVSILFRDRKVEFRYGRARGGRLKISFPRGEKNESRLTLHARRAGETAAGSSFVRCSYWQVGQPQSHNISA
jgi:hypothetical protein